MIPRKDVFGDEALGAVIVLMTGVAVIVIVSRGAR
jgi:hypothetical protein